MTIMYTWAQATYIRVIGILTFVFIDADKQLATRDRLPPSHAGYWDYDMPRPPLHLSTLSAKNMLYWIIFEADAETIELWTVVNAFIWGAWLMNPWMDVFTTTNIYSTMSLIPELIWGLVAMTAACVQLWGRLRGHTRAVQLGARTTAGLWMFGAAAIAYENWRLASIITYPMMAAASLFVSFRAVRHEHYQPLKAQEVTGVRSP